jgi:TIR domain
MKTSIFISYAWTSHKHRELIRQLATQIRWLGYAVLIDSSEQYGASLSGFMRSVIEADRVLIIVDENYVNRADQLPDSGVGIENKWIKSVFNEKPNSWLSVLYVNNPRFSLPAWLADHQPKGFNFNSCPSKEQFPGVEQIDDLWRWIEGLPSDKAHALSPAQYLERLARIERIDAMRDPANYTNPALEGRVTFQYRDFKYYTLGHGEYEFKVNFSGRSSNGVYVYIDSGLKAVGLITNPNFDFQSVASFLVLGRTVEPHLGQMVVMMNSLGAMAIMKIEGVQEEVNAAAYIHPSVTFSYRILIER